MWISMCALNTQGSQSQVLVLLPGSGGQKFLSLQSCNLKVHGQGNERFCVSSETSLLALKRTDFTLQDSQGCLWACGSVF